jgi:hypothetical protein
MRKECVILNCIETAMSESNLLIDVIILNLLFISTSSWNGIIVLDSSCFIL